MFLVDHQVAAQRDSIPPLAARSGIHSVRLSGAIGWVGDDALRPCLSTHIRR